MAFADMEKDACASLKMLYESGLDSPLASDGDGPAKLLPYLVDTLEEVVAGISPMAEDKARVLSSATLTRVSSHLYLRDPPTRLDELLEPVDGQRCTAAAAAVKGQVEALLKKFLTVEPASPIGGAADPATKANDPADGDAADGKVLTDNGAQR